MVQVDVITGDPRHRRWTIEEKQSILAAAFAPGAVVREVARRVNVSTGQLYTWRKQLMTRLTAQNGFAQVVAVTEQPGPATPFPAQALPPLPAPKQACAPPSLPIFASDIPAIEIEVRGSRARLPLNVPPDLAAAVIRALVQRP